MREIKFRAWDKEQQYMAYQGTPDLETISSFFFHFGEDILMQFTGLTDKNGKDIYEGDIIKWDDGSNGAYWRIAEIFYDNKEAMFSFKIIDCINCHIQKGYAFGGNFFYRDGSQLEIIGNIYENPELLTNP